MLGAFGQQLLGYCYICRSSCCIHNTGQSSAQQDMRLYYNALRGFYNNQNHSMPISSEPKSNKKLLLLRK